MPSKGISRFNTRKRTEELASRDRVARYARNIVWNEVESFVRRYWKILLLLLFYPLSTVLLLSLLMRGVARWIFIGAVGISGPWMVVILIILWSGVASPLMGLEGESNTADVLRKFRHFGWFLVNGLVIKSEDIDHVLIGPAGVLVVESKWSHHKWPAGALDQNKWAVGERNKKFMSDTLGNAVRQAIRNRNDVQWRFGKSLQATTVRAVCVLWSSQDSSMDPEWFEYGEVFVVRGPALESWLKNLTEVTLDREGIERIRKEIERQALSRDELVRAKFGPPRPTLNKYIVHFVLAPFMGVVSAVSAIAVISRAGALWMVGTTVIFVVLGLLARQISSLRLFALGWIATCVALSLWFLVITIRALI